MTGTTRRRVITGSIVALVALSSSSAALLACPVCFGDPNSSMTHGLNNGIFVLLGIVFFVQAAFAAFFLRLRRAAMNDVAEAFLLRPVTSSHNCSTQERPCSGNAAEAGMLRPHTQSPADDPLAGGHV